MAPLDITSAKLNDGFLTIEVPIHQAFQWLNGFKPGKYTIEPYVERRSSNANSYCWVLCDKIAQKLGGSQTKEEVYQRAVHAVGIYKEFTGMEPDQAKTLQAAWNKLGIGWITEDGWEQDGERQFVRAYYGSSVYNRKQMARLLDYITEDARSVGVPIESEEKIQSLLREWEEHEKRLRRKP